MTHKQLFKVMVGVAMAVLVAVIVEGLASEKTPAISPEVKAAQEKMLQDLNALQPQDLIVYPDGGVAMFQHRVGIMMQVTFGDGQRFETRIPELVARSAKKVVKFGDPDWCEFVRRYHRIPTSDQRP